MITATDKALAESVVAEAMPGWDAHREYRRLDALDEQFKQQPQTPGVLADRQAVAARKAEIFRHYFSGTDTPRREPQEEAAR